MGLVSYKNIEYILLDVEGTTTSITFVRDILFPYVKKHIRHFIQEHWQNLDVSSAIEALRKQSELDVAENIEGACCIPMLTNEPTVEEISFFHNTIVDNVLWQMAVDRKTAGLKQLQGCMWATAYANKQFMGHVYEDVPTAFEKWRNDSKKIYIYSSGSVEAQKLLFQYSIYGNLLDFINGHFDTKVGQKSHPSSYSTILEKIESKGSNVLFLTDVSNEAYAAEKAGMEVCLVIRGGNFPLAEEAKNHFNCISSFSDLLIQ